MTPEGGLDADGRRGEDLPVEEQAAAIEAMGPVHHIVLVAAVEGDPLTSPLKQWSITAYGGESFVLFEPQPLEAVQQASIDVVRAGLAVLHRWWAADRRTFNSEEAIALLGERETWTETEYALAATKAGEQAFRALHERHGDAYQKALALAERRSAEFLDSHPDHPQRQAEYLEAMNKWVYTGGPRPQPPRYEDESPPHRQDVPGEVGPE
jgi:hypothetical protein